MADAKAIPPHSKESPLKKVATYCRVTTKSQKQLDSLATQEGTTLPNLNKLLSVVWVW